MPNQPPELVQDIRTRDRTKRGTKSVESNFQRMSRNIGKTLAGVGVGLGALGAAGIFAGVQIASSLTRTARELDNLSKRTGISVSQLDALGKIAKRSGADLNTIADAAQSMSERLADALKDGEESDAAEAFDLLGLSASNLINLAPEEAFYRITEALRAIEQPLLRAAYATEIFGGAGEQLVPVILNNAEGLEAQVNTLVQQGQVVTDEQVQDITELQNLWNDLELSLESLGLVFLEEFSPYLKQAIEWARDELIPWVRDTLIPAIKLILEEPELAFEIIFDVVTTGNFQVDLTEPEEEVDGAERSISSWVDAISIGLLAAFPTGAVLTALNAPFRNVATALVSGGLAAFTLAFGKQLDDEEDGTADHIADGLLIFAIGISTLLAAGVTLPGAGKLGSLKGKLAKVGSTIKSRWNPVFGNMGIVFAAAAVAQIGSKFYDEMQKERSDEDAAPYSDGIVGFLERLDEAFTSPLDAIVQGALIGSLFGPWGAAIGAAIALAIETELIEDFIKEFIAKVNEIRAAFEDNILEGLKLVAIELAKFFLYGALIYTIDTALGGAITRFGQHIGTIIANGILEGVEWGVNQAISGIESGVNLLISGINTVIRAINALAGLVDIDTGLSEITGVSLGRVSLPRLTSPITAAAEEAAQAAVVSAAAVQYGYSMAGASGGGASSATGSSSNATNPLLRALAQQGETRQANASNAATNRANARHAATDATGSSTAAGVTVNVTVTGNVYSERSIDQIVVDSVKSGQARGEIE